MSISSKVRQRQSAYSKLLPQSKRIKSALTLAIKAHDGQYRKSGEPYYEHSLAVAEILCSWGLSKYDDLLVAALLHDVPEDNMKYDLKYIREYFGARVASLVDGVTKVQASNKDLADKNTLKKVAQKSYIDPMVALIKLADRLHNMRTLGAMPKDKIAIKASETLRVYSKMAESLGLWGVKKELESLSFMYLDNKKFKAVKKAVDSDPRLSRKFLNKYRKILTKVLKENNIKATITPRINGYWSLYTKKDRAVQKGKTSFQRGYQDINDLVSMRVIVRSEIDCYKTLGVVHRHFGNLVDFDRLDEFMWGNERINGYSALQTTLNLPEGAFEIAIVTEEMESFNKMGIASLLEKGRTNLTKYILKSIFLEDGSIMFLPKNATGVDLAYSIGSRYGAEATHVLVNGKKMALSGVLPNSSVVQVVLGQKRRAPDPSLLDHCLPQTKQTIIEQLNLAASDISVAEGEIIAESSLSARGFLRLEDLGETADRLVYDYKKESLRDIYHMLGSGALSSSALSSWLNEHKITKQKVKMTSIRLEGNDAPGILKKLLGMINGNIEKVVTEISGGKFSLLILVKGMSTKEGENLRNRIQKNKAFTRIKVV